MAKRLSSLFSLSRDDKDHVETPQSYTTPSSQFPPSPSYLPTPTSHKLHKHRFTASSDIDFNENALPPLEPPPFLSESGVPRPPSSNRSGPDSRPASRNSSPHSLNENRSRPQTPSLMIPHNSTGSPARPATPNSAKISKKKTWGPGRSDKQKPEDGQGSQRAWIAGLREHIPYHLTPLLTGDKVGHAPRNPTTVTDFVNRCLTSGMNVVTPSSTSIHHLQVVVLVSRCSLPCWLTPMLWSPCEHSLRHLQSPVMPTCLRSRLYFLKCPWSQNIFVHRLSRVPRIGHP